MAGRAGHCSWGGRSLRQAGLLWRDGWRVAPVCPGDCGWSDTLWKCSCSPANDRRQWRSQAAVVCTKRWIIWCRLLCCGALLYCSEARQDLGYCAASHLLDRAGFQGGAAGPWGSILWWWGRLRGLCRLRVWFNSSLKLMTSSVKALVDPGLVGRVVATRAQGAWWMLGKDRWGTGWGRRESRMNSTAGGEWCLSLRNWRTVIPIQRADLWDGAVCTVMSICLHQTVMAISICFNVLHIDVYFCGPHLLFLSFHGSCKYSSSLSNHIHLLQLPLQLFSLITKLERLFSRRK